MDGPRSGTRTSSAPESDAAGPRHRAGPRGCGTMGGPARCRRARQRRIRPARPRGMVRCRPRAGRIADGTRSALLAPLPPPATLVLLDEHEPTHKPPGPPRLHSRDVLRQRATIEGSRLLLLSATPSVESWWRAETEQSIRADRAEHAAWPQIFDGRHARRAAEPSPHPAAHARTGGGRAPGPASAADRHATGRGAHLPGMRRSLALQRLRRPARVPSRDSNAPVPLCARPNRYRTAAPIAAAIASCRSAGIPIAWLRPFPSDSPRRRSPETIRVLRSSSARPRCWRTWRPEHSAASASSRSTTC